MESISVLRYLIFKITIYCPKNTNELSEKVAVWKKKLFVLYIKELRLSKLKLNHWEEKTLIKFLWENISRCFWAVALKP